MFATLCGAEAGSQRHWEVFDRLREIAVDMGFQPPGQKIPVRPDQGSLREWAIEQWAPGSQEADFYLAVTAPRIPGCSPIHPVRKEVEGPLFAVMVLDTHMVVSRADRGDVSGASNLDEVATSFVEFLSGLSPRT